MLSDLDKPSYGSPCNGCGLCCRLEVCQVGRMTMREAGYFEVSTPCPFIVESDGIARCAVVLSEQDSFKRGDVTDPVIARALGIGWGCTMEDAKEAA